MLKVEHITAGYGKKQVLLEDHFQAMASKQYWEQITSKITEKLMKNKINLFDCYLVGSGINNKSLADIDDIDSVMILAGNYSNEKLLSIRNMLDNLLLNIDIFNKYHFRLFDEKWFS